LEPFTSSRAQPVIAWVGTGDCYSRLERVKCARRSEAADTIPKLLRWRDFRFRSDYLLAGSDLGRHHGAGWDLLAVLCILWSFRLDFKWRLAMTQISDSESSDHCGPMTVSHWASKGQ